MGEKKCVQNFRLKMYRKESLGIPRHVWEDNIKIGRKEIMQEGRLVTGSCEDADTRQVSQHFVLPSRGTSGLFGVRWLTS